MSQDARALATRQFALAFGLDVSEEAHASAAFNGGGDRQSARHEIDRFRRRIIDRSGREAGEEFTRRVSALSACRDLTVQDELVHLLILLRKQHIREIPIQPMQPLQNIGQNLPRRPLVERSATPEGPRSPHFNRRSVSRNRVAGVQRTDSFGQADPSAFRPSSNNRMTNPPRGSLPAPGNASAVPTYFSNAHQFNSPLSMAGNPFSATNRLYEEQLRHSESSSPVSQSTGSTVVPGPARERTLRPLGGRNAGRNDVAEGTLVEELIRSALLGFQSTYYRVAGDKIRVSASCAISESMRRRLEQVLAIASDYYKLAAKQPGSDMLAESFYGSFEVLCSDYVRTVSELKHTLSRGAMGISLSVVAERLRPHSSLLTLLAALRSEMKSSERGTAILDQVYLHYVSGVIGSDSKKATGDMLESMLFVYANLIKNWLEKGLLNPHNTEFMIRERDGCGGLVTEADFVRTWNTRFYVDKDLVPAFLRCSVEIPHKILTAGKCAKLLATETYEMERHQGKINEITAKLLGDAERRLELSKVVHEISKSLCGVILDLVMERDKLRSHLRAIHSVFLLSHERFVIILFQKLCGVISDGTSISRMEQCASVALLEAVRETAFPRECPRPLPFDCSTVPLNDSPFCSARQGNRLSPSSVNLCPSYTAPRLAAIVLDDHSIRDYRTLFWSIWPVLSTRLELLDAMEILQLQSAAINKLWPNSRRCLLAFQRAFMDLGQFFDRFQAYIYDGVAHLSAHLWLLLDQAISVDDCVRAHRHYIGAVGTLVAATRKEFKLFAVQKLPESACTSLVVILEEAGKLLDVFRLFEGMVDREQMIRAGKERTAVNENSVPNETMREFEQIEEKIRRDDVEQRSVAAIRGELAKHAGNFESALRFFTSAIEGEVSQSSSLDRLVTIGAARRSGPGKKQRGGGGAKASVKLAKFVTRDGRDSYKHSK